MKQGEKNKTTDIIHDESPHSAEDREEIMEISDYDENEGDLKDKDVPTSWNTVEEAEKDDEHEINDMPAPLKDVKKQKQFEIFISGLDKEDDEEDLKKIVGTNGEINVIQMFKNPPSHLKIGPDEFFFSYTLCWVKHWRYIWKGKQFGKP